MTRLSGVSVVLPVYNEAGNITVVLEECLKALPDIAGDFEILPVNDGSTDATAERLGAFKRESRIRPLNHPQNRGYGAALRTGFAAAGKPYIFFMDSDRQFDIRELKLLAERIGEADIVAGYRLERSDPWPRRAAGWGFTFINCRLLGLQVRDLNCAFKLFRAEVLTGMPLESNGAFINAEVLGRALRKGARLVEVGVHHYPRPSGRQTGLNPFVVFRAFGELARLAWKIHVS
jgi:glycosyltransferase involved in cell wall biosynthesis